MKALVTGGAGFLGHHLVKELLKHKIETVVYDQVQPPQLLGKEYPAAMLRCVTGDILDLDRLEKAMDGCDLVFHTAAISDIATARDTPIKSIEINVVGTAKCLEAARRSTVKRFLYSSSVYVSGNRGSFYRVSKQAGESLCKSYHEEFGLEYTILRYGSIYGRETNEWNFLYCVCKALLTTGEFNYPSSPDAVREFIHINDAVRETVRIAQDAEFVNKPVLITGHQRMKIKEFFDMIQEILGRAIKINYTPATQHRHYAITPYSFEAEVPVRINLPAYVDISEGILDCLREVQAELSKT